MENCHHQMELIDIHNESTVETSDVQSLADIDETY